MHNNNALWEFKVAGAIINDAHKKLKSKNCNPCAEMARPDSKKALALWVHGREGRKSERRSSYQSK